MATELCCGFECGIFNSHWDIIGGTPAIVTSGQRSGLRAAHFERLADTATHQLRSKTLFGVGTGILVVRAAVYFEVVPDNQCGILGAEVGGIHCGLKFYPTAGGFVRCVAGTDLGPQPVFPVQANRWYNFNLVVNTSANPWTTNGIIDGVTLGQSEFASAADLNGLKIIAGLITSGITVTGEAVIDDVLASTSLADYPLPDVRIHGRVPTADGTHNIAGTGDFQRGDTGTDILNATTTAYQLIDDVPLPSGAVDQADCWRAVAPPNATDYPEAVFGPLSGDTGTPSGAPEAVEAIAIHHQIATGAGSSEALLNDNGTTGTIFSLSGAAGVTTYRAASTHFATPPTGGAWVRGGGGDGDFDDLRVRFRCADANPDQCLDGVILEAAFRAIPQTRPKVIGQAVTRSVTY